MLRGRGRAGDAVELLHVLADALGDLLRVDQLIPGRHAEERVVLIATLNRCCFPQGAAALGDAEDDAVAGDAGSPLHAGRRRFARRPLIAAFVGDLAAAGRARVFLAKRRPRGFERLRGVRIVDANGDA